MNDFIWTTGSWIALGKQSTAVSFIIKYMGTQTKFSMRVVISGMICLITVLSTPLIASKPAMEYTKAVGFLPRAISDF